MAFRQFVQKYVATNGVKRWFFNRMGYNQYGLYHDDLYYETPEIQEAVRRLPREIQDARVYRIQRAFQLSISQSILPKEEWTKFEDDLKNRYLQPYIDEVKKEKKEKDLWAKMH
ncbi:Cytochrome b-c1 complex subunit 7 like protein [Argiope bruennichi]|uniref:Cytochrome b-c1 complex subunit 7 n=1 Tax=Argiope bruennichi TaxID=94029 RepID=A0A8T0F7G7_ARGBR|nr:Cytochrome b-c1 complex subunit 7 like protein [Argiope bruennichi]